MSTPTMNYKTAAATLFAHAAGNIALQNYVLFPVLEDGASTMAHLDPSIIIDTPFPLEILRNFSLFSFGWTFSIMIFSWHQSGQSISSSKALFFQIAVLLGISSIFLHFIFILCGFHPKYYPIHAFIAAFYLGSNCILPVLFAGPTVLSTLSARQLIKSKRKNNVTNQILSSLGAIFEYLLGPCYDRNSQQIHQHKSHPLHEQQQLNIQFKIQKLHQNIILGTFIGIVACAILRILDHGMQIQRFPIPLVLGITWGRLGGVLIGVFLEKLGY